jgi:DNA-binding transcriptional LysR family regulator
MRQMSQALRHLRIADLELFITAAHLKNLSKAAVIHNLSQSAASAAIMRVETAFRYPLCMHEKRHFRLTYEGMTLVPRAEEWLKQFRETVMTDAPRPIRLATTHAIARVVVPAILPIEAIDLQLMRPDSAYGLVLRDEADIALVPDNAPWDGVLSIEVGLGSFQLYSSITDAPLGPVLLPENQIEVLRLIQKWNQTHENPLEIKARIPSWSLIADICSCSKDVGFLPDFLAKRVGLHPVSWQPTPSHYRILALYRPSKGDFQIRLNKFIKQCSAMFHSTDFKKS